VTRRQLVRLAGLFGLAFAACGESQLPLDFSGPTAEWREWGGDKGGLHFSPLTQIRRENVGALEVAWIHRSGDFSLGQDGSAATAFQVTPLVVNDSLYYCTPFMRVFALDPETGAEKWVFDPVLRGKQAGGPYPLTCRGVSYWEAPNAKAGHACRKRLLYGTRDSELIALDADTGKPCADFGREGRVDLREGLGDIPQWETYTTSPPAIIGDLAVIGALVADQLRSDAPSGVVRAYDVRSGARVWEWDPIPPGFDRPLRPGERYHRGTPNAWPPISADPERGLVFVPMGNPGPDSYAGERHGLDYYGSSTVALDAATGRVVWRFQAVHHDVWDFDMPAQPTLFQLDGVGGGRPGVAQPTKMGFLFLLDRETGEPLYPVEERPVPQGGVPGERLSPTQPFPTHPKPLHPMELSADAMFGFTPIDRAACRREFEKYRWEGFFTPPSLQGSVTMPHAGGGMNWGGVAIDPASATLYVNQSHVAQVYKLYPRAEFEKLNPADFIYPDELYPMQGTPYGLYRKTLLSSFGAPCSPPPWGSLTAVDLRSGEVKWRVPIGTPQDKAPWPIGQLYAHLGSPSFGGGLATAGGLYFTGASTDRYFRAFDTASGEELFRDRIPFNGNSVPMSFRLGPESRQFVVVAAGGNPLTAIGDALIAYAVPESN
jgi:quinoprotein glucose dehydrogenase